MTGIVITQRSFDKLVFHEITSEALYNKSYAKPHWPPIGTSGITLGIGFDLGFHTAAELEQAWGPVLSADDISLLKKVIGLTSQNAKNALASVKQISIPLEKAKIVFHNFSLPKAAKELFAYNPKVVDLFPDAQGALLSLVYNRGRGTVDKPGSNRRKEMKEVQRLISVKDYKGISEQILAMRRLWPETSGLYTRRTDEAALVANSDRQYSQSELINL